MSKIKRHGIKEFLKIESKMHNLDSDAWIAEQMNCIQNIINTPNESIDIMDKFKMAVSTAIVGADMASKGVFLSFHEIEQGWLLLRKSILYRFVYPLVVYRRWQLDTSENPNEVTGVSSIANTAALSLLISPVEGYWLMERIEQSLSDNSFYWFDTVSLSRSFETFRR